MFSRHRVSQFRSSHTTHARKKERTNNFLRKYPELVCACLPSASARAVNALGRHPQLQPRPLGEDSPPQSWARGVDTYDWRAVASTLVDFVLTVTFSMHRRDLTPILPPAQHHCIQAPSATHSTWHVSELDKIVFPIFLSKPPTRLTPSWSAECESPTLAIYQQ